MKLQIADIATDEKQELQGFKVLGVFPFYLKYIKVGTHIKLCKIKELIQKESPKEQKNSDFYDYELMHKITPLIIDYCVTALINDRSMRWFFDWALRRKLRGCGHSHILSLYMTILKLNEPAFFLTYYKLMTQKDHTLLKADKQS